jgi:hypothetical protein
MQSFITILTFHYPHELDIVRSYLEAHGIECFAKDEFTVQNDHMFSPAVGGVKLQVRQGDYARAEQLLIAVGHLRKEPQPAHHKTAKWQQFAANIPLLRNWQPEYRITFVVGLILAVLLFSIYILFFS